MKVLMISGDINILSTGSGARARLELQRGQVEQLDVFVWPQVHARRKILLDARQNAYDIVTAQDPFWRGFFALRIARRTGAKLNLQVHTDLSAQNVFRRMLASLLLRRADSVRVVSEKIQGQVRALGVKVPVHVLSVYVDIQPFKNLVPQPHNQKTILWIGRFEAEKDPLAAIDVLKKVRAEGISAKLVMLGAGSLEPMLRKSTEILPIEFPGWHDPKPYLQTADVVLSTSRHESWGASIIEALAAGVPVVAPDVGIAREAGAVVVPRTELASAVLKVLRSSERGVLKMVIPSADEWARAWQATLV
ncbi:glycosyltransferase [Candidatus Parcubacteria bacterium]|nr:glycosyltransferase [Candidatus Parcubacteria bacterium]